jgi:hypothetical protein
MRQSVASLSCVLVVAIWAAAARADQAEALKYYGRGVRDVHRGQYFSAIQHLDLASAHDHRDPRIYFYRGLAKLRLGWQYDAIADFQMGSQLEVALGRRDVGRAL